MFKNLSLGTKIGGGFGAVLLGSLAIGGTGIGTVLYLERNQNDHEAVVGIQARMYDARLAATRFLVSKGDADAEASRKLLGEVELDAVHPDPDVRGLELWLGSLRDARRSGRRS